MSAFDAESTRRARAEDAVDRLSAENERLREALRAYSSAYPCPGFEVGDGTTSGCGGPLHATDDCPTCAVVLEITNVPGASA